MSSIEKSGGLTKKLRTVLSTSNYILFDRETKFLVGKHINVAKISDHGLLNRCRVICEM